MAEPPIEGRLVLASADFVMQSHRVHGVSVLPGVSFLDVVCRLLAAHGWALAEIELSHLFFPEIVATRDGFDREIRIRLDAPAGGKRALAAVSRWLEAGEPRSGWRQNLVGEVVRCPEPPPWSAPGAVFDLDAYAAAAGTVGEPARRDVDELYRRARGEGIVHGPAMRCRGPMLQGPQGLLARLELEEGPEDGEEPFLFHPAQLDASTLVAFADTPVAGSEPFIPLFLERFRAVAPLGPRCHVQVPCPEVLAPSKDLVHNDYFLLDEAGRAIARFDKLSCKRIRHPGLVTRLLDEVEGPRPRAVAVPALELAAAPSAGRPEAGFTALLRERVAAALGVAPSSVRTDQGFYDLGLDSVAMVRLARELEGPVGAPLYPTLLFEHTDVEGLARHLEERFGPLAASPPPAAAREPGPASTRTEPRGELGALCLRERWRPAPLGREADGTVVADGTGGAGLGTLAVVGAEAELLAALRRLGPGPVVAVEAGDRDGLARLLAEAAGSGRPCGLLRLLPPAPAAEPDLDALRFPFDVLRDLAAAVVEQRLAGRTGLMMAFGGGGGPTAWARQALGSLAATLSAEVPHLACRAVDLGEGGGVEETALRLLAEVADLLAGGGSLPEVRYRGGERQAPRAEPFTAEPFTPAGEAASPLRAGGVYLVTGGQGGLGLRLADFLAERYRARLVLAGRRPAGAELGERLVRWRGLGAEAHYLAADVADHSQAAALVERARALWGRLDGIFHLAGALDDGLFFRQGPEAVAAVLRPKMLGALWLDEATRGDDLSCFVLFSSLAATLPNPGQSAYAWANRFLERFAEARAARPGARGKTLAIGWPLWEEGGMRPPAEAVAAAREGSGQAPLPTEMGLALLLAGLQSRESRFAVAFGELPRLEARFGRPLEAVTAELVTAKPVAPGPVAPGPVEDDGIAVIGLAGRYPEAPDLDAFWRLLAAGRDAIGEIPAERWDHARHFDPERGKRGKTWGRWGGFLAGVDRFAPSFFGISRREAERMDPQERLFLTTAWRTLEDAGYTPRSLAGETVGVFAGVMWSHYQLFEDEEGVAPSALHAAVANRVSYCLDLDGPSLALDTACSSSLTAVHLALESLRRGECTLALAGGVNVTLHPQKYLQLAVGRFLSDDGRCRSFGRDGSGYVPGEGVGAVLLKPLARALADGDAIRAVIRGSAANHTGRTSGFTVPEPASQAAVIRRAWQRAGVDPAQVSYLEAHGTGTALGDPIEVEALGKVLSPLGVPPGHCAVGSVKSNVGHLESAAGIAGLTKVLLQLEHRALVPSLHAEELNPHIDFARAPVRVQRRLEPWPGLPGGRRFAGVSAFGAGGANAHLVVEGRERWHPEAARPWDGPCLLVFSSPDEELLRAHAERWLAWLGRPAEGAPGSGGRSALLAAVADLLEVPAEALDPRETLADLGLDAVGLALLEGRLGRRGLDLGRSLEEQAIGGEEPSLDDLAFTLQVGRVPLAARLAIVARDRRELAAGLERFLRGERPAASPAAGQVPAAELFRSGRLAELGERWAGGEEVPWASFYPREGPWRRPRRVSSLPTSPWREERCWVGAWAARRETSNQQASNREAPPVAPPDLAAFAQEPAEGAELRRLDGGIALVVLREATFSSGLLASLEAIFAAIAADPALRAVVVTGSGKVFSMGATREGLEGLARGESRFTDVPFVYQGLPRCDRPVVTAIQGHAAGGGLAFGLFGDLVVMAREAVYSAPFLRYGFTPGMGASFVLEHRFGAELAAEMMLTGREFSGAELERRGARVQVRPAAEVLPAALALARAVAEQPPAAAQALKRELGRRLLERLGGVIEGEARLHNEVLGEAALERIEARFARLEPGAGGTPSAPGAGGEPEAEPDAAREADPEADRHAVRRAIEAALAAHLYVDPAELDPGRTFHELGVDSISAVEIVHQLNRELGVRLDAVALYDHATVDRLTAALLGQRAEQRALERAAVMPPPRRESATEPPAPIELRPLVATAPAPAPLRRRDAPIELRPLAPPAAPRPASAPAAAERHDIAVIGMAGRFPGAPDLRAFWRNLEAGVSSVAPVPPERWDLDSVFDPDRLATGKTYSRWAALLEGVDRFDAAFFHLSPLEAQAMSPEQRLFLETAWAGLEDAGYGGGGGLPCGVFAGATGSDYLELLRQAGEAESGQAFLGDAASVLAARVAYALDLRGPTLALDTACSSSLVAVHLAAESLRRGECELALAGGVALMLTPRMQVWTSRIGMLSPTGRSAAFDRSADGIVLGEGVGVVVLKPLDRALADGDTIRGVIRGSGINGDGKTNGLTAPSALSQAELMARVWRQAGVDAEAIGYVEAHGTGTPLGDPIEVKALTSVCRRTTERRGFCGLGSVKTNIGHTTMAAGIASLLKVLLALEHRRLPPSVGFEAPNPHLELEESPFYVVRTARDWEPGAGGERIAAVSSFGFSGTNCHLVVAEAPRSASPGIAAPRTPRPGVEAPVPVLLSARTEAALARYRAALAAWPLAEEDLPDLAFTLAVGRRHHARRAAYLVRDVADLRFQLQGPGVAGPEVAGGGPEAALAARFLAGEDPAAFDAFRSGGGRRIPLPTYPFEPERHWVAAGSGGRERTYGPESPLLAEHRVEGRPLLPGAELLVLAAAEAGRESDGREGGGRGVALSEVRWLRPIEVAGRRTLRLVARGPQAPAEERVLELVAAEAPERCLARAVVARGSAAPPPAADPAALAARCPERIPGAELYRRFAGAGIEYGPSFRRLGQVDRGRGEALGWLEGRAGEGPRLATQDLDAALQAVAALRPEGSSLALPARLGRFELFPSEAPPRFAHVRARESRFDVDLLDAAGRCLARFQDLELAPPRDPLAGMFFVPGWQEAPALPVAPPAEERVAIVAGAGHEALAAALSALHGGAAVVAASTDGGLASLHPPYQRLYFLAGEAAGAAGEHPATLALFRLCRRLLAAQSRQPLRLVVYTSGAAAVSAGEAPRPHTAGLFGLARALAAECPWWRVGCVDGLGGEPAVLAAALAREPLAEGLVALRGERRWQRRFERLALGAPAKEPFRRRGVYLLVGGAGGLGQALSRHLAERFQARLVWLGRRPLDEALRARIAELEALGGEVLYRQADVADREALGRAVAAARERFGTLHGAFHSALELANGALVEMDEERFRAALRPKVEGAVALAEALAGENLDFLLFFSSAASFVEVGGQANYAAASTFEDAFALSLAARVPFQVAVVNWGFWGSVGAVAGEQWGRRFANLGLGPIEPAQGIEAIRRQLAAGVPQVLVLRGAAGAGGEAGLSAAALARLGLPLAEVPSAPDLAASRAGFAALERLAGARVAACFPDPRQLEGRELAARHPRLAAALGELVARQGRSSEEAPSAAELVARHPDLAPHVELLEAAVAALPEVLAGRRSGMEVLFPGGSSDRVERIYRGQVVADRFHRRLAAEALAVARRARQEGRRARLLEVGAGTGAATGFVLAALAEASLEADYCYTDVSAAFLRHGEERFGGRAGLSFRLLDLEREPAEQGFAAGTFDAVVAVHVLHAMADVAATLGRLRHLLVPGGVLLLDEITRRSDFLTVTFGLTAGWWAFRDGERLPHGPLLDLAGWRRVLARAGFAAPRVADEAGEDQALLVAEAAPVAATSPSAGAPSAVPLSAGTVRAYLRRSFAAVLRMDEGTLDERTTFETYGVDSLVGLQVLHRLEQDLGPLPSTLLYESLTLEGLAETLLAGHREALVLLLAADGPRPRAEPRTEMRAETRAEAPAVAVRPTPAGAEDAIAVVGVSGRYPGAPDLETFWDNLARGISSLREVPPERWDWRSFFDPRRGRAGSSYSRWGGFLDGIDLFDAGHFQILPSDAEAMDPQERLFLETAWNLLEENGYLGEHRHERATGVFVGLMYGAYGQLAAMGWSRGRISPAHSAYWSVANRVSYFFDFHGPSFAVDSACSASLTAVHLAVESLRRGECRMAIAGGVNLLLHPAHLVALSERGMLSSDGRVKVFDAAADGFQPGEGVGAVLLKPLARALADGDTLWGVIRASAVNAGGKTGGYTVPNPNSQARLVADVLERSGIEPATVSYLEAHGTGTALGDPIEVAALARAFGREPRPPCALGSVKANVGHLEGAAGIAGLTKVLLQLRHRQLAPAVHLDQPSPRIDFDSAPFVPQRQLSPWCAPEGAEGRPVPLRAGVSSFGAGGANAHLIVEEAPALPRSPLPAAAGPQLFLLSARTATQLAAYAGRVAAFLARGGEDLPSLDALAASSQLGRLERGERLAVLAASHAELAERLAAAAEGQPIRDQAIGGEAAEGLWRGSSGAGAELGELLDAADAAGWVETLLAERRLPALARLWTRGTSIDWRRLWPEPAPRAVFPTTPFERRRYWLETEPAAAAEPDGPAIVRPESLGLAAADHRVGGEPWLPGAALLELARRAVPGTTDACRVLELSWPRPLRLPLDPQGETPALRLVLDGQSFRLESREPDEAVFLRGRFAPPAAPEPFPSLDELRSRLRPADPEALYAELRRGGLEHGAPLQAVEALWRGEGECLARLVRPPAAASVGGAGSPTDPVLLDGALAALAALVASDAGGFVPLGWRSAAFHRGLPSPLWVWAREVGRHRYELRGADGEGETVFTIEELEIAPLPEAPESAPVCFRRVVWEPAPLAEGSGDLGRVLVVGEEDALRAAVAARLRERGVAHELLPTPGDGEGSPWGPRLEGLEAPPDRVLWLGSRAPFEAEEEALRARVRRGFEALLALAGELLRRRGDRPLVLLYAHFGEPQPAEAAVGAALSTLGLEHPAFVGRRLCLAEPEEEAALAARLLAELGSEGGETEAVRHSGGGRWRKTLVPFEPPPLDPQVGSGLPLRAGGTYLLTGGAGALGLLMAERMVREVPLRLVLVGRSELDGERRLRVEALGRGGAEVVYRRVDLGRSGEVETLIAEVEARFGPLRGIVHAAGVRRDARAVRKTPAEIEEVLAPKVFATAALDRATAHHPLDFFVLFSSLVGETGNPGQVDYAYANAFLHELASWREGLRRAGRRSGRTLAVGWGLWRDGGMAVEAATRELFARRFGMAPMATEAGFGALGRALASTETALVAFAATAAPAPAVAAPPAERLAAAQIEAELRRLAARFLLIDEAEVDVEAELLEAGFDSISLTQLVNQASERFGLDLSPTVLFAHPSLAAFARHLEGALGARASLPAPAAAPAVHVRPPRTPAAEGIAIVGRAGQLPGAPDLESFWPRLVAGEDLVSAVPADREDLCRHPGTRFVRGGFLDRVDRFDAAFFGIAPQEAALMDPQQRLFLETAWRALEDGGWPPRELAGRAVGLFVGAGTSDYADLLREHRVPIAAHMASGIAHSILANRLSYLLDWQGPSEAIDTACSSSLVAVHRAVASLERGECEMALAGGVNVLLSPALFLAFEQSGMLSPGGRCRTFDRDADGYVRGEGVGVVVLKPLARALADGDSIRAVVRGSAVNHGGRTNSLTAPSPEAQARVVLAAWRRAGLDPATASLIEAHGTGTRLGDPVEVEGLGTAFSQLYREWGRSAPATPHVALGSVKTQIGHLEAAAGVAGLLKVLLAMEHGELPPHPHLGELNPLLRLGETPFFVPTQRGPWPGLPDEDGQLRRRAGISSFGFGGANAHLVVEAWPQPAPRRPVEPARFERRRHWFAAAPEPVPAALEVPASPAAAGPSGPARPGGKLRLADLGGLDGPAPPSRAARAAPAAVGEVAALVKGRLSELLGLPAEEIPEDRPFGELGLDSIFGLELMRQVNAVFALDLKAGELYQHDTVARLCRYVEAQRAGAEGAPSGAPSGVPSGAAAGSATAELSALLAEVLGRPVDAAGSFPETLTSFEMLRVVHVLEKRWGALQKTLLFDQPTLGELARFLAGRARRAAPPPAVAPPRPRPAAGDGAEPRALLVRRQDLEARPELAERVAELDRHFGMESGLAGRDIAPWVFFGARRRAYLKVSRRDRLHLAWSAVGPPAELPALAAEWVRFARERGFEACLLSLAPLEEAAGVRFTATPFGVVQRLEGLDRFRLEGGAMRRLRYLVSRFESAGTASVEEHRSGADPAIDREIAALVDRWSAGKTMVNRYVGRVRREIERGVLDPRHRIFLTRLDGRLVNAVIITRLPSESSYLLDLELYPPDMPLGGLELAITRIFARLVEEGSTSFSFGASFGVKVCESPNPDPELAAALADLKARGLFDGEGNFRFKNKFRPRNLPLYLCAEAGRSPDPGALILAIAEPDVAEPDVAEPDVAKPGDTGAPEPAGREARLAAHGYNPLRLPRREVDFDLVTDSWAELEAPFVERRMAELRARAAERGSFEPDWPALLGVEHAFAFRSGRAAEAALVRALSGRGTRVLGAAPFPSWRLSLAEHGFELVELEPAPTLAGPFRGELDLGRLEAALAAGAERLAFVVLEASNNAWGGHPFSLAHLRRVRQRTAARGVPLVLDATRLLENACSITEHEAGERGRGVWEVVGEVLALVDACTWSLSKDFGIDGGGLVAIRDRELAQLLGERLALCGEELNLSSRRLLALALEDRQGALAGVRRRRAAVEHLGRRLGEAGWPLASAPGAHAVLLEVGRLPELAGHRQPVASFLAWLYREAGVRAAPHLAASGSPLAGAVRLAVPVGVGFEEVEAVAERLVSCWQRRGEIPDLVAVEAAPGLSGAAAGYHPAERVPAVIAQALREARRARDQNLEILAEHCPGVERRLVRHEHGVAEVFLAGRGPSVVLMHPFNIGAGLFLRQLEGLRGRLRLVVVHHPGVGASRSTGDLDLAALADLCRGVLGEIGVAAPLHLVGASFGGLLAQTFALCHPADCASLTLVCSSHKAGNRSGPISPLVQVVTEDFDRLLAGTGSPRLAAERAAITELLLAAESMDPQTGLRYLDVFEGSPGLRERLPELTVPTLVIQGAQDSVIDLETTRQLLEGIPGARYLELAEAGHFPSLTHAEELNRALLAFITEQEARRLRLVEVKP
ncbi:MAG TPA: SDR family NAD(P)-dependent oxidoreductase [Thermoanaerobaculia bacterium]|nr:SDR family NAD(P)-dependent oxidoreductase [Thermoanaerobaculia bacterium]